ncbi:hypothetical protein ABK040_006428 [Willaertia magna]
MSTKLTNRMIIVNDSNMKVSEKESCCLDLDQLKQSFEIIILNQKKVNNQMFLNLYGQIHELLQNQNKEISSFLFQSLQTIIINLLKIQIPKWYHSLKDKEEDEIFYSIWNLNIKLIDLYCQRLFKGRQYFISCYPEIIVLGSFLFDKLLECQCQTSNNDIVINYHQVIEKTSENNSLFPTIKINNLTLQKLHSEINNYFKNSVNDFNEKFYGKNVQYIQQEPIPRHKFTRTKNLIHYIEDNMNVEFNELYNNKLFNRMDIPLSDKSSEHGKPIAFYIDDFLTNEECNQLIKKSNEIGYLTLEHEFLKQDRDNDRALIHYPVFANILWNRLKSILQNDNYIWNELRPFGWHNEGKWNPNRINPCMRFCKYVAPSVGFLPHRDGNFVPSMDERSIFTMLIYLNDDFEGGTTDFLTAHEPGVMGELVREEIARGMSKEFSLQPKKGRIVVFDHHLLHQGSPLISGEKYIIRTDIVLTRVENTSPDLSYMKDPDYQKMLYLYRIAAEYEVRGRVDMSSDCYERALSMRLHFPKRPTRDYISELDMKL